MALTIVHRRGGLPLPIEIRPHIGASLAAGLAREAWFKIGEPDVIGPCVRADRDRVGAMEIGAIHQHTAHA